MSLPESFTARVKKVLQLPADDALDVNQALVEHGVDSLVALDIRSWFLRELNVDVPVLKILGGNSIADLIKHSISKIPAAIVDVSKLAADGDAGADLPDNGKPEGAEERNGFTSKSATASPAAHAKAQLLVPSSLVSAANSNAGTRTSWSSDEDENAAAMSDSSVDGSIDHPVSRRDKIVKASSETTERMSFGQTRFWYLHHALPDTTTFNVAISIRLEGPVRVDALGDALRAVARRHEAMRTRYFWSGEDNDVPMQGVLSNPLVSLEHRQISQKSEAAEALEEMRDHRWDLGDWESMKFVLLTLTDDCHWLIFGCHHITLDGVGIQIIFADLEKAYLGQILPPLPEESQYRSYSAAQRVDFQQGKFQEGIDFFRKSIPADAQPIPLLPFSKVRARPPQESYR